MRTHHLAVIFSLFVLLASACGAPPPSNTSSPAAATYTSVPTEAATLEASPSVTPTDVELQLEVIESVIWTDETGFVLDALVRNPYDFPVSVNDVSATFYDSEGNILLEITNAYFTVLSGGLPQIVPGGIVPVTCSSCFNYEEPAWDSYELVIRVNEEAPLMYSTALEAAVTLYDVDPTYLSVDGTVKNIGDERLESVSIILIVRDQEGNFIGAGPQQFTIPPTEVLEPGMTIYFAASIHVRVVGKPVIDFVTTGIVANE